jgi:predicted flavoprotein YhiN
LTRHFQTIVKSARVHLLHDAKGFSRGIVFVYVHSKADGEAIINTSHYFRSDQNRSQFVLVDLEWGLDSKEIYNKQTEEKNRKIFLKGIT